ncbi:MAG TPA: DUF4265 domain-containing protein [Mycobacterium sp.]|nr:DUF4265 domain-containing protein [Mycobacterium sp.]
MPDMVKVRFLLPRDDEGWPPAESEGLWAEPMGDDLYRIDNTPWFVRNLSQDDIVKALAGSDGVLWAVEKVEASGRQTVRVIARSDGPLRGDPVAVRESFESLGVPCEVMQQPVRMAALDIPSEVRSRDVKALLVERQADGWWDFEEGCVTQEWLAI